MTDKQTCDGLDCAWCVVFDCPIENERRKARVKELEEEIEELKAQRDTYVSLMNVYKAISKGRQDSQNVLKYIDKLEQYKASYEATQKQNNDLELENRKLKEKLKIAEETLKQIASGVFLPAYRSYLAEKALQKMEEII